MPLAPVVIGSDHAGFELKQQLKAFLLQQGYAVEDVGCFDTNSVDYPLVSEQVALKLQQTPLAKGLLICGSGVGVTIAVNRFAWVRAVWAHDVYLATLSREHNDTNVLCLGARLIALPLAEIVLESWLKAPFDGGRHQYRVNLLGQQGLSPNPVSSC